ncbi:MAG: hypothetical protein V7724_09920 [Sediminicola sp.]|tara:strand:+ start:10967 stop:11269 length:303 start_codon:yes stop_codon:yes gene_type:complete
MRLPTLFKLNRNKSYNYSPRYYNERKERLENLKKAKAAREEQSDKPYFTGYRKKSYRDDWKTVRSNAGNRNRRLRFYAILIFLLIFAYAVIKYGKMDVLF